MDKYRVCELIGHWFIKGKCFHCFKKAVLPKQEEKLDGQKTTARGI